MTDETMEKIKAHVALCSECSGANGRVNDFCEEGRLLFLEYAKHHTPTRAEMVEVTDEQYDRMVAEQRRRERSAGRN
jgi:hypothetical protein